MHRARSFAVSPIAARFFIAVGLAMTIAIPSHAEEPPVARWWAPTVMDGPAGSQIPTMARVLADGTTMVVGSDNAWVVATRYDATGALTSTARWSPPYSARLAIDAFGGVVVAGTASGNVWMMKYDGVSGHALWPGAVTIGSPTRNESIADVAVDEAGNAFLVAGMSAVAGGTSDILTAKCSSADGSVVWTSTYDSGVSESATAITVGAGGAAFVAGTRSTNGGDLLTLKYDASGTLAWQATYNGPANSSDFPRDIAVDASGAAVVVGSSHNAINYDFITLRYTAAGSVAWSQRFNGAAANSADEAHLVAIDAGGNVAVVGTSVAPAGSTLTTLRYSSAGAPLWTATYNGPENGNETPVGIATDGAGDVIVTGYMPNSPSEDAITIKYSAASGTQAWANPFNGPNDSFDRPVAPVVDQDGAVLVPLSTYNGLDRDQLLLRYNTGGGTEWSVRYAGEQVPVTAFQIAVDGSGNTYVAGSTPNPENWGVIKFDAAGARLWAVSIGDPAQRDYVLGIAVDSAGDVFVIGFTDGSSFWVTKKLSGVDGATLWSRNSPAATGPHALGVDANGDVVVTGRITATGNEDVHTIKYRSSDGVTLWSSTYAGPAGNLDRPAALAFTSSNDVVVTGMSRGATSTGDALTLRLSGSNGSVQWSRTYSSAGTYEDGGLIVKVGTGDDIVVAGFVGSPTAQNDYLILKYDSAGTALWARVYGTAGYESPQALAIEPSGAIYATWSSNPLITQLYDATIARLSGATGLAEWSQTMVSPGQTDDYFTSVVVDPAGNAIVGGHANGFGFAALVIRKYAAADGAIVWSTGAPFPVGSAAGKIVSRPDGLGVVAMLNNLYTAMSYTNSLSVTSLPDLPVASCAPYTFALQAAGGSTPYTWNVVSGDLPPGLTILPDGTLQGTTSAVGSYSFRARALDAVGGSSERDFILDVVPGQPVVVMADVNPVCTGSTATLSAPGDFTAYDWLPGNATTAAFQVSPGHPATYGVRVTEADGCIRRGSIAIGTTAGVAPTTVTAPATVVEGTAFTASVPDAGLGATYSWSIDRGIISAGQGTPEATFTAGTPGMATVRGVVTAPSGCGATDTASVTIESANQVPTANDGTLAVAEDGSVPVDLSAFASDPDVGQTLTYEIIGGPSNGALIGTPPSMTYGPTEDYFGSDSFTYRVTDPSGAQDSGTITVTVTSVNDPPTLGAIPDPAPIAEDSGSQSVQVSATAGPANEAGQTLTYAVAAADPSFFSSLTVNATGLISYSSAANRHGSTSIVVTVGDGEAQTSRSFTVTVTAVNDPPVADAQVVTTAEDTAVGVNLSGTDADGDTLTYAVTIAPANGILSGTAPSFTYTPAPNFNGLDSFSYRANDGLADSPPVTVSITVSSVNDAPVAVADSYATVGATLTVGAPAGVLGNDSDIDGDTLEAAVVSGLAHGSLTLNADGSFTYTPVAGFFGSDSFTYSVSDGNGGTAQATVTITVTEAALFKDGFE